MRKETFLRDRSSTIERFKITGKLNYTRAARKKYLEQQYLSIITKTDVKIVHIYQN